MSATERKRQRAADQTTITFSCSGELKEKIRKAAKAEHRSISNWVVYRLEQVLHPGGEIETARPRLRRVADGKDEYES